MFMLGKMLFLTFLLCLSHVYVVDGWRALAWTSSVSSCSRLGAFSDDQDELFNPFKQKKVFTRANTDNEELIAKLLSQIRETDEKAKPQEDIEERTMAAITSQYSQIFNLLQDLDLTPNEKASLMMEVKHELVSSEEGGSVAKEAGLPSLPVTFFQTAMLAETKLPLLLVHGSGLVSQRILSILQGFGKLGQQQIRIIDASNVLAMRDVEIRLAVQNVQSILLTPDTMPKVSTGWFGRTESTDSDSTLSQKALQRLLNAAMKDGNREEGGIKVVCLGKACKPPKSISSIFSGDTTTFDSEVILECKQRNLGYLVIKVGQIIAQGEALSVNAKIRTPARDAVPANAQVPGRDIITPPVIFTTSNVVESTEVTTADMAAEALLRAVSYPNRNSSISVLSTTSTASPTSLQWDDEFVKLDGPELLRIPLRYSDARQAVLMSRRLAERLKAPGLGLITPIAVETFSNGVRIVFKPVESNYKSAKEEEEQHRKAQQAKEEEERLKQQATKKQTKGYLPPEKDQDEELLEIAQLKAQLKTGQSSSSVKPNEADSKTVSKKKKQEVLEGGLDVVIEDYPYPRIRVRRCLMGPTTIAKEESEAIILRTLQRYVDSMETDMRLLMSS